MADERTRNSVGPFQLRVESGRLIAPNEVASKIENMYLTDTGSLRSVQGPVPYQPTYPVAATTDPDPGLSFQRSAGVFHCLLQGGERDVLLWHVVYTGSPTNLSVIQEHKGWDVNAGAPYGTTLLAPAGIPAQVNADIDLSLRAQFPTQFESTPDGVVIVPQGGIAYFYDGEVIAPLGFPERPGSPSAEGPQTDLTLGTDPPPNNIGYAHRGEEPGVFPTITNSANGPFVTMPFGFGNCRVGTSASSDTISSNTISQKNAYGGFLRAGNWKCSVQFIDRWGNLSPLSTPSGDIRLQKMENVDTDAAAAYLQDQTVDSMRYQLLWTGIDTGPNHCVGRILARTKDLSNSGDGNFYELPSNFGGGFLEFSTIPDNITDTFPDNVPDTSLITEATDAVAVPKFKLCKVAFGRLWIANFDNEPGALRYSILNKWGTFEKDALIYPDPSGNEVTGLWPTDQGLLVFTDSSTFLFTLNSDGDGFRASTLSTTVGCVAPSTLKTMNNGQTVWLGEKGFYSYSGTTLDQLSIVIQPTIRRINIARRRQAIAAVDLEMDEYRCWVPVDGSTTNNLCLIYDGEGWRQRNDVKATSVCVTKDHRNYMLATGEVSKSTGTDHSLWLLDREALSYTRASARESVVQTAWLKSIQSMRRSTLLTVYIWMRATEKGDLTVEAYRDWREYPIIETTAGATYPPKLYAQEDPPSFWDEAITGSADATWVRRRPFWVKVDFHMPSCEVFKLKFKYSGDWEFVGMLFEDRDVHGGGVQVAP
jgi:hypothetical protein